MSMRARCAGGGGFYIAHIIVPYRTLSCPIECSHNKARGAGGGALVGRGEILSIFPTCDRRLCRAMWNRSWTRIILNCIILYYIILHHAQQVVWNRSWKRNIDHVILYYIILYYIILYYIILYYIINRWCGTDPGSATSS